jgi:hypothetical protein
MKTNYLSQFKPPFKHSLIALSLLGCINLNAQSKSLKSSSDNGHNHDHGHEKNKPLHVNETLGNCDFEISPLLTQNEWKTFAKEGGNLISLNPLASSKPLGKYKWDFQVETTTSDVNDNKGAWNNTMHHPDSAHTLTDNGRVAVPGFRFRIGVTERMDVGAYYAPSQPFGANYGFLGLEAKYAFINDTEKNWAASVRGSYTFDANIRDFNLGVATIDVTASKTFFNLITPYAGFMTNWNHVNEVTNKVDLEREHFIGFRGIVGAELRYKFLNLGYECMIGDGFNNRALKIGVTF